MRNQYDEQIEELKTQQEKAIAKLEKLQSASEDAWEELKVGTVKQHYGH